MSQENDRQLPDGWQWVKLGDVCELIMGQSPPSSSYINEPRGLPFFQGKADFGKISPIPRFWCFEPIKIAEVGDILISVRAPVGPTNIVDVQCCIGRGLAAIRPNQDSERDFIHAALRLYENKLVSLGSGSTFEAIGRKDLETLKIPLPPLSEQKRIAAILNEQMEAVEKARKATEAQLEAAKALPAAYLRAVFESEEANSWERRKLGDIALSIQNGLYKSADYYGQGSPFIRMYNIHNSSWQLNIKELAQVLVDNKEIEKYSLDEGDLLVSRVNSYELVGKCGWVNSKIKGYIFENMLIRLSFDNSVNSLFLAQQMNSNIIRKKIQALAKRAIGQSSINSTDLKNLELNLPPLPKQQQIASTLTEQMQEVERLKQNLKEQLDTINKLPAVLLRRAFKGEL